MITRWISLSRYGQFTQVSGLQHPHIASPAVRFLMAHRAGGSRPRLTSSPPSVFGVLAHLPAAVREQLIKTVFGLG